MKKFIEKIRDTYIYCINWIKNKWKELIIPVSLEDKVKETVSMINPKVTITQLVDLVDYMFKTDFVKVGDICV